MFELKTFTSLMRKLFTPLIALALLSSCSAHKNLISNRQARRNNDDVRRANGDGSGYPTYTTLQYIDRFKSIAIQEMNTSGIPASITLAQGIFESGSGNGELARVANNHFGIKCTSDYTGRSYYKDDDQHNDCFRVYTNPEDSYRDHTTFLKRKRYAHLFELDKNDYRGWAKGLKDAGYATNPAYPQLLIGVIEKYNLHQYDQPEGEVQKIKREDRVLSQINNNIGVAAKDSVSISAPKAADTANATNVDKLYTVKQGDTLYNISKRFGLTVDELKALNNMADNNIKIGQQLVIAK